MVKIEPFGVEQASDTLLFTFFLWIRHNINIFHDRPDKPRSALGSISNIR